MLIYINMFPKCLVKNRLSTFYASSKLEFLSERLKGSRHALAASDERQSGGGCGGGAAGWRGGGGGVPGGSGKNELPSKSGRASGRGKGEYRGGGGALQ